MIRYLFFGTARSKSISIDAALLVLRLFAGFTMAFSHGFGKIPPSARLVEITGNMGFPFPEFFAWSAGISEFIGGLFIALGLMTRPSAILWICTMSAAFFIQHGGDPFSDRELAFVYLQIAFTFLIAGAGRFSLDSKISKKPTLI